MGGILERRLSEGTGARQGEPESSAQGRPESTGGRDARDGSWMEQKLAGARKARDGGDGLGASHADKAASAFAGAADAEDEELSASAASPDAPVSDEDIEMLNELDGLMSGQPYEKHLKKERRYKRAMQAVLSAACLYMVVLIHGTFITEFRYDEKGELSPVVLSVDEIGMRDEYSSVLAMYLQARELYEKVLVLDYRVASGAEDTMGVAPEYETALDTVSTLGVQIDASTVSSRYNQVKNMLLTWVQTHIAAYCQYMSAAISQNDSAAAEEALAARQVVNDYFQMITLNIVTMGEDLDFDLSDIKEWSPEGYVQSAILGAGQEETEG